MQPVTSRPPRTGYLPSLDGWRAVAIFAVLMDHDEPWHYHTYTNEFWHQYGGWGVFLFFAISGLLVCTRILEDEALLGRFHVGAYYIRRFFRIQPAAFVYVGTIALLTLAGVAHESSRALRGSLFLYSNYQFNSGNISGDWFLTGHFWTLSIEEHFYLVLSLLLLTFKKYRASIFTGVLILLYIYQRAAEHFQIYSPATSPRHTELNIQYLLTPALFAILLRKKEFRDFIIKYLRPWVAFAGTVIVKAIWFAIYPLVPGDPHKHLNWVLIPPIILFYAFEFWVVATVFHPRSWTTRFLELKPMRYIGRLSYGIYLWHALFVIGRLPQTHITAHWLLVLTERPWRYVATIVMALLSYYLIEKPLIRIGHRLAPPATPGHADLNDTQQTADPALASSVV